MRKTTIVKARELRTDVHPLYSTPKKGRLRKPCSLQTGEGILLEEPRGRRTCGKWSLVGYWGVADHVKLYLTVLFTLGFYAHTG
jgi:hypothetical protein